MLTSVHPDSIIGIKKLSDADLGISYTSNQTHIGLFTATLSFLNSEHHILSSQLIYEDKVFDLLSLLDYIENPDGTFRSPKIRTGNESELYVENQKVNSVVRGIREIVKISPKENWYLLWLGLETNELVFLLLKENSLDFKEISDKIGDISGRDRIQIDHSSRGFKALIAYLNQKVDSVNIEYYEELEIASQTGEGTVTKRVVKRARDFERANKLFKETGRKGEELLNSYFEIQKRESAIKDFVWVNKSRETGLPYDFEITNLNGNVIFSDAKSTSYKFNLPIILSYGELDFIRDNKNKYHIHRLYSIEEEPRLRVCDNIYEVSDIFIPNYEKFTEKISKSKLAIRGLKLAVPTDLDFLNFNNEILIRSASRDQL